MRLASHYMLRGAVLLVGAALIGCDEPAAPDDEPVPTSGAINVTVTAGGTPVENASVLLYGPGQPPSLSTARTPVNGRVTFGALEPGSYEVAASATGGYAGHDRVPVEVLAGHQVGVAVALLPEEEVAPYGSLGVRVVDEDGAPIADVAVSSGAVFVNTATRFTATDADGWAYFLRLSAQEFFVDIEVPAGFELAEPQTNRQVAAVALGQTLPLTWVLRAAD